MAPTATSALPASPYRRVAALGERILNPSLLLLVQRLGVASIFFLSARTKVEGWFSLSDATFELFQLEYALPLIPPAAAAWAATITPHARCRPRSSLKATVLVVAQLPG
jgi:putative oxidoreductase